MRLELGLRTNDEPTEWAQIYCSSEASGGNQRNIHIAHHSHISFYEETRYHYMECLLIFINFFTRLPAIATFCTPIDTSHTKCQSNKMELGTWTSALLRIVFFILTHT